MSDSNHNCCCGCAYSTPPWWVTMGFVPPYHGQVPSEGLPFVGGGQVNSGTTVTPPAVGGSPGKPATPPRPGGLIGNVAGGFANAAGDVAGGIAGAVGSVAGGIGNAVGDVASGLGNLLGGLF